MVTVWLVCVSGITFLLWFLFKCYQRKHKYELPPILPGALPFIGHAYKFLGDHENLWQFLKCVALESNSQGGVVIVLVCHQVYYIITDPEDALTFSNATTLKHFAYGYAKTWLGNGLITSSGEIWKRHRRLLNPAFGQPVVVGFLHIFNDQSRMLVKDIDIHNGIGPFDPSKYIRNRSLETFCLTAFGVENITSDFLKKYMDAVDEMLLLLTLRFQKIHLQSDLIFKLLGYKKRETRVLKILNAMSNEIMQKKRLVMESMISPDHDKKHKPLLDLLLELSDADMLTDAEIREEIDTAIVAGFDTSAILLVSIFTYLGSYPDVQNKMYRELIDVLGLKRDVEKDDLERLVYTDAVIKETLRVMPIAPALLRYTDKDVKLKNYIVPAGSHCILMSYGTHRLSIWGDDSEHFKPERWLDVDKLPKVLSSAYGGFSWGKRSCIGKTYAMISMKVTLAHFFRQYTVKADVNKVRRGVDVMLKAISGHEITVERRN